jgi:hypothetical protein
MLAIVARQHDPVARDLADTWGLEREVGLLTCQDLSTAGWRHSVATDCEAPATAVVGGRVIEARQLDAVLTLLPVVTEAELPHIAPADQTYVAGEMNAFLLSWLSSLGCRVVNRPTARSLAGPGWRPEHWVRIAALLGAPVRQVEVGGPTVDAAVVATVVGERCVGDVHHALAAHALALARVAGVDLLDVQFSGPESNAELIGANPWPDLGRPDVAHALLERLVTGC